jgi:hypothetical protein
MKIRLSGSFCPRRLHCKLRLQVLRRSRLPVARNFGGAQQALDGLSSSDGEHFLPEFYKDTPRRGARALRLAGSSGNESMAGGC